MPLGCSPAEPTLLPGVDASRVTARLRLRLWGPLCRVGIVLLLVLARPACGAEMELVLSEESGAYTELADALSADLGRQAGIRRVSAATLERETGNGPGPDVVLALGTRALGAALAARSAPVVAALVPMESFDRMLRGAPRTGDARTVSGVYLDQPVKRRLNLVQLALPGKERIGVLISPERETELKQLQDAAAVRHLTLVAQRVSSAQALYPALARLLTDADLLLALPDASIFNSGNIHNILLATYRARLPLLGFSASYVQAGALAAVYSTPRQIAPQVAELALRALGGRSLPPPQYPRAFRVSVNQTVARSLGLQLDEAATLEAKLLALESEP